MNETVEWLLQQHASREKFKPFAHKAGIVSLPEAYAVQSEFNARRLAARKTSVAGYKIGLTSARMQQMCGIDEPIAGTIFNDVVHRSGVALPRTGYVRLGLEFEIAVRMKRDLAAADPSFDDVAAAIEGMAPAVEIVEDRDSDYLTLDVLSLVADNSWNGGVVLGEFAPLDRDLASVEGLLFVDGSAQPTDSGKGADVLGHPFHAVAWLVRHLASQGKALRAGQVVMTGSIVTTKFPQQPGNWRFELAGVGDVHVEVV